MCVEIGIEFVAYAMIFVLPPDHHESGFRSSLHILDDESRDDFQVLDVYFVNHLVLVVDFKIFLTFVVMSLKPFIVSFMLDSEKSNTCMMMNPENSKSSLMLHKTRTLGLLFSTLIVFRLQWSCPIKISKSQASVVPRMQVISLFVMSLKTFLEFNKSGPTPRFLPFRDFSCRSRALVSL